MQQTWCPTCKAVRIQSVFCWSCGAKTERVKPPYCDFCGFAPESALAASDRFCRECGAKRPTPVGMGMEVLRGD